LIYRRKTPAQGTHYKRTYKYGRRATVVFDEELFDAIRKYAIKTNVSFAYAVRDLTDCGLAIRDP
jgi:predicted dinucleotide-utilizing enzyme